MPGLSQPPLRSAFPALVGGQLVAYTAVRKIFGEDCLMIKNIWILFPYSLKE
jgi:hypothetical protein